MGTLRCLHLRPYMLVELSMEVGAYAGEAKYGGAERVIYAVVIERSMSVERIFRRSRALPSCHVTSRL